MGVRKLKITKGGTLYEHVSERMPNVMDDLPDDKRMELNIWWADPFQWPVMRDRTTYEITWGGNPRGVWCAR